MERADKSPVSPSPSGVLGVDKPGGPSSSRVVAIVRRRAGGARTGHAGTLDPLATGVLVLGLGQATKLLPRLLGSDKAYETRIDLSAFSETDDHESEPTPVHVGRPPSAGEVRDAVARFTGVFEQRPPAFSALKVGGRRAYRMARRGAVTPLAPRPVVVHALDVVDYEWPMLDLALRCGKGFYVRSLARDLGLALGTGGHCESIRRTAVGPFTLEMAWPLDDVPEPLTDGHLLSNDEALAMVVGTGDAGTRRAGDGDSGDAS